MKKIKILYTTSNFDTAGSGKVLFDLANGIDKNKFEVVIACNHNQGIYFKEVEKLGLPIYFQKVTVPLRPYFSLVFRVNPYRKFIKEQKIDIIHSWHWSSDWTEILAAKLAGAKYVYTKKAMTWGNIHWKIKSYLANFIITINEDMIHYFPYKKQQQLIPIGIDTNFYNPELFDNKKNFTNFKIISVVNIAPVKNLEILIYAVNALRNHNVFLEIVGDSRSDYAQQLKALVIQLKLETKVNFIAKQNDVRPFLKSADLYVICSKHEGMPMALVEAMTMGVPVLGTNCMGVNFVLKDFPEYLIPSDDSVILAQKIMEMLQLSAQERAQIGAKLRAYCINHFSIQNFVSKHEMVYQNLVKK